MSWICDEESGDQNETGEENFLPMQLTSILDF